VDIVLDSSAIINLVNGGCIDKVLSIGEHNYFVGDLITDHEILNPIQKVVLETLIETGLLTLLDARIPLSRVIELQNKHSLGLGETECIAICVATGYSICTDDSKARNCSKKEIGENKVIGSLYLLREAVRAGTLSCPEALKIYVRMKVKGGFLPSGLTDNYFCR
jgi:predicted nucleic acid-binding protein